MQHAQHAGHQRDHEQHRQDEDHDREQHLDSGFADGGFGAETAARAERIGVDFQRLRQAGAEALALDDHRGERLDVFDAGAADQLLEGLAALLPGAHLHDYRIEFVREFGIDVLHFFADAKHGLIEREAGAEHDAEQIDGIGQRFLQLAR